MLGAPLCENCQVWGQLTEQHINGSSWACPICGSRTLGSSMDFFNPIYENNLRLWKFVKGEDNEPSAST